MELLSKMRDQLRGGSGIAVSSNRTPEFNSNNDDNTLFKYSHLRHGFRSKSFRLLRLFPSSDIASGVRCELFHSQIAKHPPYEALSYTWGDPNIKAPISLNGIQHQVTMNLELALRWLRYEDKERIMWVDALCINQTDIPEKNLQVSLMRNIYVGAERVVVWLGEEGHTMTAIDFCGDIHPNGLRLDMDGCSPDQLAACKDLFIDRPYWKRMWVIQEVYHGNNVLFQAGRVCIPVDVFYDMAFRYIKFSAMRDFVEHPHQSWLDMMVEKNVILSALDQSRIKYKERAAADPGMNLVELLHKFRVQSATDPRDMVFALLGIAERKCGLEADYNLTIRDVYINTTKHLFKSSALPLLMVESVNRIISQNQELPSWVPDFSDPQTVLPRFMFLYQDCFDAGTFDLRMIKGAVPCVVRVTSSVLTLRGVAVAIVNDVLTSQIPVRGGNEGFGRIALIKYRDIRAWHEATAAVPEWKSNATYRNTSWAPSRTEIGDIVVVAATCSVPFILRRVGDCYLFVGVCCLIKSTFLEKVNVSNVHASIRTDPGLAEIMRGSIWRDVGSTLELEDFNII